MGTYDEVYDRSMADPEGFWGEAATAIDWDTPPATVLDDSQPALLPLVPRRPAQRLLQRRSTATSTGATGRGATSRR